MTAESDSVGGRETRADSLRQRLADLIITGEIAPGSRLDEQDIAGRFGMSRTPVREALRQLAAIGLAEQRPHKGVVVRALSADELAETFELMADLEALCARYAAVRMTAAERRLLDDSYQRSARFVQQGDTEAYNSANQVFHELIYRGSHNTPLIETTLAVRLRVAAYRRGQFRLLGSLSRSYSEHGTVVEAILRGDAAAAQAAMADHVSTVRDRSAAYVAGADAARRAAR